MALAQHAGWACTHEGVLEPAYAALACPEAGPMVHRGGALGMAKGAWRRVSCCHATMGSRETPSQELSFGLWSLESVGVCAS